MNIMTVLRMQHRQQVVCKALVLVCLIMSSTQSVRLAAAAAMAGAPPPATAAELAQSLLDAFSSASSAVTNFTAPSVKAAAGPSPTSFPVGSGDNLLAFRKRVKALKGYYKDARTYLGADNAVLLGGYIARLERLEIQFITAFPVAELAYYVAQLGLLGNILQTVYESLRFAGNATNLARRILALKIALEKARRAAVAAATSPSPPSPPSRAAAAPGASGTAAAAAALLGTGPSGVAAAPSVLDTLSPNNALLQQLMQASQALNAQVMPYIQRGGPLGPMSLATNILASAAQTLQRINAYAPPAGLLNVF